MSRTRVVPVLAAVATGLVLLVGGWTPTGSLAAERVGAAAAPAAGPAQHGPRRDVRVRVEGDLRRRDRLSIGDLETRFAQQSVTTTFTAQGRPTTRTFTGPLLLDVLTAAEPRFDDRVSNDQLAFAVRVGATDGYRAVVAWGEIDPGFAGTRVLLATTEDGRRLERPRLVVPGDARGGRYVTDVTDVRLVDLGGGKR